MVALVWPMRRQVRGFDGVSEGAAVTSAILRFAQPFDRSDGTALARGAATTFRSRAAQEPRVRRVCVHTMSEARDAEGSAQPAR